MTKIIKNTTVSDILLGDIGFNLAASVSFTIPKIQYSEFADSQDLETVILNGNIIVNNGVMDLAPIAGVDYLELGKTEVVNPRSRVMFFDDFSSADNTGAYGWTAVVSGAGATVSVGTGSNVFPDHPGVLNFQTGTTTTGKAASVCGEIKIGSGDYVFEAVIKLTNLSTIAEDYNLIIGLADTPATGATPTTGIHFQYNRTQSANWRCVSTVSSVSTLTTSAVAVNTNWIKVHFRINNASDKIEFRINDTLLATHTTNIPTGQAICPIIKILKSAGTTSRNAFVDYVNYTYTLSTSR